MVVNVARCKLAFRLALGSLVVSLLAVALLALQFQMRKTLDFGPALFIASLAGFFGALLVAHVFAGWLAVLNGVSWVTYGLQPILKPVGGIAFSLLELRGLGKKNGWA